MTTTVPKHPAVVLRSRRYTQLKALLAMAMIAVVGLSVSVALLAVRNGPGGSPDPLSLMTAADTRYAEAISSLSDAQLSAAFGTENGGGFVYPPAQRLSSGKYLYP
jgi:hypothetical protein